jgi:nitrite reductase/ring-hydroxylating ferredoxin subunit
VPDDLSAYGFQRKRKRSQQLKKKVLPFGIIYAPVSGGAVPTGPDPVYQLRRRHSSIQSQDAKLKLALDPDVVEWDRPKICRTHQSSRDLRSGHRQRGDCFAGPRLTLVLGSLHHFGWRQRASGPIWLKKSLKEERDLANLTSWTPAPTL